MMNSLRPKVRYRIRKAAKCGLTAEMRGQDALSDFYAIFAERMRELGTPVYSKSYFSEIFRAFGADTSHLRGQSPGETGRGDFPDCLRKTIESLYSSSRRQFAKMEPTALLDWSICGYSRPPKGLSHL